MRALFELLSQPSGIILFALFFLLTFAAVSYSFMFLERRNLRRRVTHELELDYGEDAMNKPGGKSSFMNELFPDLGQRFKAYFQRFERWSYRKIEGERFRFEQAGIHPRYAVLYMVAVNLAVVVFLSTLYFFFVGPALEGNPRQKLVEYVFIILILYMGIRFFDFLLDSLIRYRQNKIAEAMPYALDLMAVCVRSGMGVQATFLTIANELKRDFPVLCSEFERTARELALVPDVRVTLGNLALRSNVPIMRQMCTAFIQSHEQGTSISQSIFMLSREFVRERMLQIEAKAGKISALSVLPIIFFLLPCTMAIIFSPPAYNMMKIKDDEMKNLKESGLPASNLSDEELGETTLDVEIAPSLQLESDTASETPTQPQEQQTDGNADSPFETSQDQQGQRL